MERRNFIAFIGGAAMTWPLVARAQQPVIPLIGILGSGSLSAFVDHLDAFRQGLRETGYIDGQNVAIESRWAEGRFERLPDLVAELVQRRVAVIVTTGVSSTLAVKAASPTIPQLFLSQQDPVKLGLVTSFNRPGGNATGVSLLKGALVAKRLEFLRQLTPSQAETFYLMNPHAAEAQGHLGYMQDAARNSGRPFVVLNASSESEINDAFAALAQKQSRALIVSTDPFFVSRSHQIVVLAAHHKIPTIYDRREFVATGGLISYGTHLVDACRQIGVYAGKIIKGAAPSELPVMQPTRFELVINLKTARILRLDIPDKLLALADEVIE